MQKHKLVKDIDEEIWRKFIAYCVLKDVRVGEELNRLLKENLRGKIK